MAQQYLLWTYMQVEECVQCWGYTNESDNTSLRILKERKSKCSKQVILKHN